MTIVAAVHEPGVGTWIGSDSLVHYGDIAYRGIYKWTRGANCAIACAGFSRARNVFDEHVEKVCLPTIGKTTEAMREALKGDGWHAIGEPGEPPRWKFDAVVAYCDCVYLVDAHFGFAPCAPHELAVQGSGEEVALGAYSAARELGLRCGDALDLAIRIACRHIMSCQEPRRVDLLPLCP